jgi:hypothetical protein
MTYLPCMNSPQPLTYTCKHHSCIYTCHPYHSLPTLTNTGLKVGELSNTQFIAHNAPSYTKHFTTSKPIPCPTVRPCPSCYQPGSSTFVCNSKLDVRIMVEMVRLSSLIWNTHNSPHIPCTASQQRIISYHSGVMKSKCWEGRRAQNICLYTLPVSCQHDLKCVVYIRLFLFGFTYIGCGKVACCLFELLGAAS